MTAKQKESEFKKFRVTPAKKIRWRSDISFACPPLHVFHPPMNTVTKTGSPLRYFSQYFPGIVFEEMSEKTNLYAVQENVAHFPATNPNEMKKFVGIMIMMGNLQYPRVRLYWDSKLGIPFISQCMTLNRFFKLRNCVHIVDSRKNPNNNDRIWKVRPWYNYLRRRCLDLPLETNLCIDEQMVPFKGQIDIKQYMKDKPSAWGIKIFNLCGASGLLYDFIVYQGATTELNIDYNAFGVPAATVMTLLQRVTSRGHFVYFDNYFSSYQLLQWLRERDLYSGCTVRLNRFGHPPIRKKKDIKKMTRGSSNEYISKDGIVLTEWIDRRAIYLASNYVGKGMCFTQIFPVFTIPDSYFCLFSLGQQDTCQRWISKELKTITRPEIVANYNRSMGGVDRLDQLISLYRTFIRSRKWTLRMMTHAFDLGIACAWLEYRKDCDALNVPRNQQLDLIHFRHEIAESLTMAGQTFLPRNKRGRPSSSSGSPSPSPSTSRSSTPVPQESLLVDTPTGKKREVRANLDVRTDQLSHWPLLGLTQRCKMHNCTQRTTVLCTKCNVHLCLTRERNCFTSYHNK